MENFDPRPQEVKEKSFYTLNLDTPRIIILTSVIIGIIAAAFLFGMSFMKGDKSQSKEMTVSDMEFDESRGSDMLNKDIPPLPGDLSADPSLADKGTSDLPGTDTNATAGTGQGRNADIASAQKQDKEDVLRNENIKEIIPPAEDKKSADKKTKTASKTVKDKSGDKKVASDTRKKQETHGKSRIYEVSKDEESRKSYDSYSVQVASYDTLSKAEKERSYLKSKSYDAYIDRATVNGRSYFRVRIGPVASKKKAAELLDEIQSESRYSGSYMVKE